ncbi:MAG: Cyclic di-GMP phosphodiesterase response regulator RpfG [Planctomycetes bacterium ADurb.Bin401]|nr:MAG: Cyclic di-GMP phosphodiesterase response regulator RpfG [Planctomycetes bacterium ADurb.Bin401]
MLESITYKKYRSPQHKAFREFGKQLAGININFFICDESLHLVEFCEDRKFESNCEQLLAFAKNMLADESETIIVEGTMVAVKFAGLDKTEILLADLGPKRPEEAAYVKVLLTNFIQHLNDEQKSTTQIELISGELAQTYEELVMLYKLSSSMKVSRSDVNYLQLACDNLSDLVKVEGLAIFIEKKIDSVKKLVLTAGYGVLAIDYKDEVELNSLFERVKAEISAGTDVLLDSQIDSPFRYSWTDRVKNIIAVPLYSSDNIIGMMIATNRIGKSDFDSIDSKLFNSVASECAVFIENNRLFNDLKELFIGSLKALTNSIDAKDQYTRGHSERVAFISRWIAEQFAQTASSIDFDSIQKIYLSGLLHDIGKIGISESVLRKKGGLTDEERSQIMNHPSIGAGILSGIKQMNDIIPGVLYHHEKYNGTGYPNQLAGNKIPLAGKIVMIADTFDAMTSKRTYRDALSPQEAIDEITANLGEQFDPDIGEIFIKSDIKKMWEIIQSGKMDEYYTDNFSNYGALAVGALLK